MHSLFARASLLHRLQCWSSTEPTPNPRLTVQPRWGIEVRIAVTHRAWETLDAVNPQIPDVQRRKIIIIFNFYPKNRGGQLFSNQQ